MGLDLPFCAGRWRRVTWAEGCDRAAPTSVVGGTRQWWGVGTEPSGYDVGVVAGGSSLCTAKHVPKDEVE